MAARTSYDLELTLLQDELITMGVLANTAIEKAIKALTTFDKELCKEVINGDRVIDETEREIEHRCLKMLLRQQPVASDLRLISTAMKMITDIERIGDGAADIAEIARHTKQETTPACFSKIPKMANLAQQMVQNAITAFVKTDLQLAQDIILQDDRVDDMFNQLKNEIAMDISSSQEKIDTAIDCLMIIKYLERIGDHAVNICEWVEFCKTGIHKQTKIV